VFGGEFAMLMRFGEMPGCDETPIADADKNKIMHIALPIGKNNVIMGTDALESMGQNVSFGTNISISIAAESKEEAEQLFIGLSEGGNIAMPLQDTFWGAYFGIADDKFGVKWMVNYDYPKN